MIIKVYKSGKIVIEVNQDICFCLEPIKSFDDVRHYNLVCKLEDGYGIPNVEAIVVKPLKRLYKNNLIVAINSMKNVLTELNDEVAKNRIVWKFEK